MATSSMMDYDVVEARYVRDYVVWLRFRDGTSGEVDIEPSMRGPVFEPLRNPENFRQFFVHPELATLAWPNNVDLAPEVLHQNVRMAVPPISADADVGNSPTHRHDSSRSAPIVRAPVLRRPADATPMPEISRFFGIVVSMYYDEHGPPHFHARMGEFWVSVEVEREIVRGEFPAASLRQVLEWTRLHRAELFANWERARNGQELVAIEPLR